MQKSTYINWGFAVIAPGVAYFLSGPILAGCALFVGFVMITMGYSKSDDDEKAPSLLTLEPPSVILRPPTEEERLCPHPLHYSLRELPKPKENNYATELTVRNDKELMLTVDIYIRTLYSNAFFTHPLGANNQVVALELSKFDLSHLKVVATKGLPEFTLEIHTFQPLRLKCVNLSN